MKNEEQKLLKEIDELEEQIKPKRDRLHEIWRSQNENIETRIKLAKQGKASFNLKELRFAAFNRCPCGAGLAYPINIGVRGAWYCSDILLGRATLGNQPNSKSHTEEYPFMFYEIKSEDQPSAAGATTRPEK